MKPYLYLLFVSFLFSCSNDITVEATINHEFVKCDVESQDQCIEIKRSNEQDWQVIPNAIEGFNYEEGYNYNLRLSYNEKKNSYNLIEVISKTKVLEDINYKTWIVTSIGNSKLSTRAFLKFSPESQSIKGYTGCNTFNGSAKFSNDEISISNVAMTKKLCPDSDMENEIISTLQKAKKYDVVEGILHFTTEDGDILMKLKTEDQ